MDALPMRLRHEVIGALNLFHADSGELGATALRDAQALPDVEREAVREAAAGL